MLDLILHVLSSFATVFACVWLFIFTKAIIIRIQTGDTYASLLYLKNLNDKFKSKRY